MYYKNDTIIIREFTPQELHLFLDLFTNENVTRYLPYKSPAEFKEMFKKALSDYQEGPFSRWGIFDAKNNAFVGMCLARAFHHNPDQTEIGYILGENYWGKGIGTQICQALIGYCLSTDEKKDIVAITDLNNIGSQKVLLKSGFNRNENLMEGDRELAYFLYSKD